MEGISVNKRDDFTECITQHIPFVFEEPSSQWKKLKVGEQNNLLHLGAFSTSRLLYIDTIYLVYQHKTRVQMTLASDFSIPHGQDYLKKQGSLPSTICKINIHCDKKTLQENSTSTIQIILLDDTNLDAIFDQVKKIFCPRTIIFQIKEV